MTSGSAVALKYALIDFAAKPSEPLPLSAISTYEAETREPSASNISRYAVRRIFVVNGLFICRLYIPFSALRKSVGSSERESTAVL